jgi:MFS family permease
MNAISLNSVSFNVARVIGPLVAGVVMTAAGEGWCFAANGLGFMVLVATILAMRMPRRQTGRAGPLGRSLVAGLDYARRHPVIRAMLLLCFTLSLFGFPFVVLMPALAKDVLGQGADGFTRLFSSVGAGAVVGGLGLALAGDVRRKGDLIVGCALAFGLLLIVVANSASFLGAAVTFGFVGAAMIMCIASLNTLVQMTVDENMRTRVMSMVTVSLFGLPTLGAWMLGAIGDRIGIPAALSLGGGMVATAAVAVFLFAPEVREVGAKA